MKRAVVFLSLALAVAIASPAVVRAQIPTPAPTPTPNPMVYDDPAMHFQAPAGFYLAGVRKVDVSKLGEDPELVAGWVYPNPDHPRRLFIEQEYYEGDVHDFDGVLEEQMRSQYQEALFKDKQNTSLRNGMPAIFVTMSTGEGFDVQRLFILMWADGQRGVAIVLQTKLGDNIDAPTARMMLSDVSAVQYPVNMP
ncbi:MAG TPA: hypothetical protein VMF11_09020 [Candidatus Baltobacteraceae bacterium]|nr:hypothetical protein [Candidatus Baltobacteraceae bacterium]